MAAKEVKALLKSARTALDNQKYDEAVKQCEAVFWLDEGHYIGHVIAGKALLLLDRREDAKCHYRKAIETNSQEQLAWKGLADLYDKHPPGNREDKMDAIHVHSHMLDIQTDNNKKIVLMIKLTQLYKDTGNIEKASVIYQRLLGSDVSHDVQLECIMFLLSEAEFPDNTWKQIEVSYRTLLNYERGVSEETRKKLKKTFIKGFLRWMKSLPVEEVSNLKVILQEECENILKEEEGEGVVIALETLCLMGLWNMIKDISLSGRLPVLTDKQTLLFSRFGENKSTGLSLCCLATVMMNTKQIKDGCKLADEATSLSPDICEYWAISCVSHLMSHDYHKTINIAKDGLKRLSNAPYYIKDILNICFNLWYAECLLLTNENELAVENSRQLYTERSHDYHVTNLYIRALLANDMIEEAEKVLSSLNSPSHIIISLKGQIRMANKDYEMANSHFESCLKEESNSSFYHYLLGTCLLNSPNGDHKRAYHLLIKAAQLDSFDPRIFLQLGNYQRHVTQDFKRAVKCYQRSFSIYPGLIETGLSLGEMHTALGDDDTAFKIYQELIKHAMPSQAKEAWLRVGLHHRRCGQYEDAIKCFLKVLHQDSSDVHVWECIGEAYLTRGSHTSALKAFTKAIELNPQSLYCQYQIASIKQLIGQLPDAIEGYTAVLKIDSTYVPALKGRAEGYFGLALESLEKCFDGKAVDLISAALMDLTTAAQTKPGFKCLWKLIGDCCLCLHDVAPNIARPKVPAPLLGNHDDVILVTKQELLQLAARSYSHALSLSDGHSSFLLHNMSLAYYYQGQLLQNTSEQDSKEKLNTALQIMKKAVSLSPSNQQHWNALGVIASHSLVAQLSLAQHAFIKSLHGEPNNAIAWVNLGSLYFINGNIMLAHSAFERAQSCDPGHVQGWVGDALVAETIGKEDETKNLFHISSELKYHPESALGYSYWVCQTLSSSEEGDLLLSPSGLTLNPSAHQGLVQSRDEAVRYVLRNPQDACGLNLLGLLYEQERLLGPAERALEQSMLLLADEGSSSSPYLIQVMTNYARLLSSTGKHSKSLELYQTLNTTNISLQHALALFRAGKFQEANSAYKEMLTSCDSDKKPHLLLASALTSLADKDSEECKFQLFKVFQTPPPLLHGLISLAAFAGYSGDITLSQATLNEVAKIIEWDVVSVKHLHPSCRKALKSIIKYLSQKEEASQCCDTVKLILDKLPVYDDITMEPMTQDIIELIMRQSPDESLYTLQKLVHMYPDNVWVWSLLPYLLIVLGKRRDIALTYLKLLSFKVQVSLDEIHHHGNQLLQVKTNKLQSLQLLNSWIKQMKTNLQ